MSFNTQRRLTIVLIVVAAFTYMTRPAGATSLPTLMSANTRLVDDLSAIGDAGRSADIDGLSSACADLSYDASTMLSYTRPKPVPKAAWREMRIAWRLYVESGDTCQEGADTIDAELISEASDLMQEATPHIDRATDLL